MATTHPGGFDAARADRIIRFAEKLNIMTDDGPRPLRLFPFQEELLRELYGRCDIEDPSLRAYRTAFWAFPRRSSKSLLAAVQVLYNLTSEINGAQCLIGAATAANGLVILRMVMDIIDATPALAGRLHVKEYLKRVEDPITKSFVQVITSEAKTQFGFSVNFAVIDEFFAQPDSSLMDMIRTSTGSRKNALVVMITTAGFDKSSYPYQVWQYADRVEKGLVVDHTFHARIYSAPPEAAWDDLDAIIKCNPAIQCGFKSLGDIKAMITSGQEIISVRDAIRVLHMNQWTTPSTGYIPMDKWQLCSTYDPEETAGLTWYVGADYSVSDDFTAIAAVCRLPDNRLAVEMWVFAPESSRQRYKLRPWHEWIAAGAIELTSGNVVDYDRLFDTLMEICESRNVAEIAYDRAYGSALMQRVENELVARGISTVCVQQPQGFKTTLGTKMLLERVIGGTLAHNSQPVLTFSASYAAAEYGTIGGVRLVKRKSLEKIDPVSALVNAIQREELASTMPPPEPVVRRVFAMAL